MDFWPRKSLSCGVLIFNPQAALLLCHVTGQNHWDLPKGGQDGDETAVQTALRETQEETGLALWAEQLVDLGRHRYRPRKALHLFATLLPHVDLADLRCASQFSERSNGRRLPEMDGYGWFALERIPDLCTTNMCKLLLERLDLGAVWQSLQNAPGMAAQTSQTSQTSAAPRPSASQLPVANDAAC